MSETLIERTFYQDEANWVAAEYIPSVKVVIITQMFLGEQSQVALTPYELKRMLAVIPKEDGEDAD